MAKKRTMEDWFLRGGARPSEDDRLPEPPEEIEIPPDDDDDDDDEGSYCPECSAYIPGDEEVCPVCGEPLRRFCPRCGGENPPDETECTHCGASLEIVASDLSPSGEASPAAAIFGVDNDGWDDDDEDDCPDCGGASPGGFGPLWRPW